MTNAILGIVFSMVGMTPIVALKLLLCWFALGIACEIALAVVMLR